MHFLWGLFLAISGPVFVCCCFAFVSPQEAYPVSKLVFYAQSTSVVISGRRKHSHVFTNKKTNARVCLATVSLILTVDRNVRSDLLLR